MNKTMIVTNTVINYKLPPSVSTHGGAIWGGRSPPINLVVWVITQMNAPIIVLYILYFQHVKFSTV